MSPNVTSAEPAPRLSDAERFVQLVEQAVTGSLTDELGRCPPAMQSGYECPLNRLLPYSAKLRMEGEDWPPAGHTMVGHRRLRNIRQALEGAVQSLIPGAFVEVGVWRGGASIYAKAVLDVLLKDQREVHLFDAFAKIQKYAFGRGSNFLGVPVESVRHNFQKYGLHDENVFLHQGLFTDSMPVFRNATLSTRPDFSIAVLRIDGNFFDSHVDVLYHLWDFVPKGGYVIFDDGTKKGPRGAINYFFKSQGIKQTLERIPGDHTGTWGRKSSTELVNWAMWATRPIVDINLNSSLAHQNRTTLDLLGAENEEGEVD